MARLRKALAYRRVKKPYTRFSKYKQLNYVRARPPSKIARFEMGNQKETYECELHLVSRVRLQIRDSSIESARQVANRCLEKVLGKTGYHMITRAHPHHILRENPLASGAGADRMSTGMAHSFGKPIGVAAQVSEGKELFTIRTHKTNTDLAKKALKKASLKLPCRTLIVEAA